MTADPREVARDADRPPVLIPYQQTLLNSVSEQVLVYEKSRRIGISWAAAEAAVETAALTRAEGGMGVFYIGYNLDMARGFIDDSAFWAKHLGAFAGAVPTVEEFIFEDGKPEHAIRAYRITFASTFEIVALPSRPRSLRSKQGFVILDEAAFYDDLEGVLKAAFALLIWGGKVWIISTHDGDDNPFNELVEEVRAGKKPFKLLRTTFDDAVADGLHERIRYVAPKGVEIPPEAEWVEKMRAFYGDDAAEELDCVPSRGSGVFLPRALIKQCMDPAGRVAHFRFADDFVEKPEHQRASFVEAWLESEVLPLVERLDPRALSYIGGDFARTVDLTVLAPAQEEARSGRLLIPFVVELRNCPFVNQEQVLYWLCDRLPRFQSGALDARGLGAQIAENAASRYGHERIAQIKATGDWYRDTFARLKQRFEDRSILIPQDQDIQNDLRAVKKDRGIPMVPEKGRTKSSRGGERHGDAAIALVMLEHASDMDVAAYTGYQAAPASRDRLDPGAAASDDDDGGTFRENRRETPLARMKGAW